MNDIQITPSNTLNNSSLPPIEQKEQWVPAGFWIRFVAAMIDGIIVSIPTYALIIPLIIMIAATGDNSLSHLSTPISLSFALFYNLYFYTKKGATPGKMIFNMKLVDLQSGQNLSAGKVLLREWVGRFVCTITLSIGYIIAGFRPDKRGLHDMIANTQVLRKI